MLLLNGYPKMRLDDTDLAIDGNSLFEFITQSQNAAVYASLGGAGKTKLNVAVSGQTTAQMIADAVTQVDALYSSSRKVLLAWEITNDLFFGASVTQAQANFQTYCLARKAAGWKIVVLTTLPRRQTPSGITEAEYNSRLNQANIWLINSYKGFADSLLDVRSVQQFNDASNTAIFYDGVHLSTAGYALLVPEINKAIQKIKR